VTVVAAPALFTVRTRVVHPAFTGGGVSRNLRFLRCPLEPSRRLSRPEEGVPRAIERSFSA